MRHFFLLLFASVTLFSCGPNENKKDATLATGIWRATLTIQGHEVPFNMEVKKDSTNNLTVFVINAEERLLLDEVSVFGDSVRIPLHIFDASLQAKIEGNTLSGLFIKHYEKDYKIPFRAEHGIDYRFTQSDAKPVVNVTGKYRVSFFEEKDTVEAVGAFTQNGSNLTGTFLTPTGDYRFLEGNVTEDSIHLSTFDGNYVYLFNAVSKNDSLTGRFYSGKTKNVIWKALKDENAKLPDSEALTFLKPGYEKIEFKFPDVNRKTVSLSDEKYKDKVVILQIFGTWCPNCLDETKFLAPWYDKNKERGVEIIGLAYERKDDFTYASNRVKRMIEKLKVNYDFAIAGVNDKEKASKTLPMLNQVMAFPTTIFIGKDGKVKKIHTGFTGPGTGIYYEQFIEDFNETVNRLLAEKTSVASTSRL